MMHRDSLGSVQRIEPGAISWMSAGRGIVHSERKPDDLRDRDFVNHGLQLWVGLPADKEEGEPSFVHTPAGAIPQVQAGVAQVRVLVGEAFGARSPVVPASPTLYLDVALPQGGAFELPPIAAELAVYPVHGTLALDGQAMLPHQMLVVEPGSTSRIVASGPARFVVIGGDSIGPRHMYWNFVSSRKERILQASEDWSAGRFASVPGETEFIPLPPTRFTPPEPMS